MSTAQSFGFNIDPFFDANGYVLDTSLIIDNGHAAAPSTSLTTLADMAINGGQIKLNSHYDTSNFQRERRHPCTMCHKRFDRPSTLKKHFLVHTGEKAFQCDLCGRRFGIASNLNRHVRRCTVKNSSGSDLSPPPPASAKPLKRRSTDVERTRRRAPSPTLWIPGSLLPFNLTSEELQKVTPVPLAPVSPSDYLGEERDSWDENVGYTPYHPSNWDIRVVARLPGPGLAMREMRNLNWHPNSNRARFVGYGGSLMVC